MRSEILFTVTQVSDFYTHPSFNLVHNEKRCLMNHTLGLVANVAILFIWMKINKTLKFLHHPYTLVASQQSFIYM